MVEELSLSQMLVIDTRQDANEAAPASEARGTGGRGREERKMRGIGRRGGEGGMEKGFNIVTIKHSVFIVPFVIVIILPVLCGHAIGGRMPGVPGGQYDPTVHLDRW